MQILGGKRGVLWEMCKWGIAVFKSWFAFALLTYLGHENRLVEGLNDLAQSQGGKPVLYLIDPVSGGTPITVLFLGVSPWPYGPFFWSKIRSASHPRRPRGGQSGREKRRDESFQARVEKPLGTDSHRNICRRSSKSWLLIGHKKCLVLLCLIGEQHRLSSFRGFMYDGYCLAILIIALVWFVHQGCTCKGNFRFPLY